MTRFLILGGTGKAGRRLGQRLDALGHTPLLAGRSSATTRFDWHTPDRYREVLSGVDGLFIVGPGSASDWSPRLATLLAEAAAAGVQRAVLLSARGVEFLPDGVVARAEDAFAAGPVPGTILRPTHFAQNFTEAMFVPVDGQIFAPVGAARHPFIDVADIADVAARILTEGGHDGEVVPLSGPRALGFAEAAGLLAEISGSPVEYVAESHEEHVARLRAAGLPQTYITWRMAMLDGIAQGRDEYVSDGTPRVLGRPATSFEQWAAREVTATTAVG